MPAARWAFDAWNDLRKVCADGTVPSEFESWCRIHRISDPDMVEEGWQLIRVMDQHVFDKRAAARSGGDA